MDPKTGYRRRPGKFIFVGLLLLGAIVRIYGAWEMRHHLNPDAGIAALMAQHIAAGRDFPVFFYGQAYMGSLEPLIGALFCALFGPSGFMVGLGTALVSWLVLLAVYLWARDAHSPLAGLAAMAYCVVGPSGFFHYQVSPRGGYAVAILLSTLVLWLGAKLIINEHFSSVGSLLASDRISEGFAQAACRRRTLPRRKYAQWFLLGLLAGLGWWANQLVVSALLTAALLGLAVLRRKIFSLNSGLAAAGFLLGSLPFWWWNFGNGWQSFEFSGSLGQTPPALGLKLFFADRLPDLLDLNHGPLAWRIFGAAVYGGAAFFLAYFLWKKIRARQSSNAIYLLAVFVFILVSALLFSTSHFARMNTSRYLLPLVPVLAVMLGVALARAAERIPRGICLLPLAVLLANQAGQLAWLPQRGAGEKAYQQQIEECGRWLAAQQISACYAPYGKHSWNFALQEKICFCDLPQDRYLPYVRRAELADRIAVFDNLGDINNFIANYGGSAPTTYSQATPIRHGFVPPGGGLAAILPEAVAAISDSQDQAILARVMDGNLDTDWESSVPDGDDEWIEIVFKKPQAVAMLRLLYRDYPEDWQIAGQGPDARWRLLTPAVPTSGYLWSGPRPYWSFGMDSFRLECRILPAEFKALRIHRIGNRCRLQEIQLFSPAPAPAGEAAVLPDLLVHLKTRGIKQLYCDRWPAGAVYRATKGAVRTTLNPSAFSACSLAVSNTIQLGPQTALLMRQEDAALGRPALADRLVAMRQTEIPPWVLFDFAPGQWQPEYGRVELHWAGFGCLAKNNKKWAAELVRRAEALAANGESGGALALLEKAGQAWPLYPPAVERRARLRGEKETGSPEIAAEIKFENGVTLAGLALSTNAAPAGGAFTIQYYWRYPAGGVKGRPCVFVHFLGGEKILQDDHPLAEFAGAEYQPYPETFVETRRLFVPLSARAGEYQIRLGLYDAARPDQRRIPARTVLPGKLNSVELPVKLTILPP